MVRTGVAQLAIIAAVITAGCEQDPIQPRNAVPSDAPHAAVLASGTLVFEPLPASYACNVSGGDYQNPFALPVDIAQSAVAREGDGGSLGNWDMNTLNETGAQAGRYLYRPTEIGSNGQVIVTDLWTGITRVLAQDPSFGSLDGIVWTKWGTVLTSEERSGGRVIEVDPETGDWHTVAAVGFRQHEGMRFDAQGNFYGISENSSGHIFKFVPDRVNDLSSGTLYALKVTSGAADKTGDAEWLAVDLAAYSGNSDAAAAAVGATTYDRPEDIEISTSTGSSRGGQILYVAVTTEQRVIAIDLREPQGGSEHATAFVWEYVKPGLNTTSEFQWPDNVALDNAGNLFITEDPGGSFAGGKRKGDDIWVATPQGLHEPAGVVARFASLTDCDAEPTGIYFDRSGKTLYVNVQHRAGNGIDLAMAITGMK